MVTVVHLFFLLFCMLLLLQWLGNSREVNGSFFTNEIIGNMEVLVAEVALSPAVTSNYLFAADLSC